MLSVVLLIGCQVRPQQPQNQSTTVVKDKSSIAFAISGKIGVTFFNDKTQKLESGSAFYAWGQQGERFAIDITGALGLGKTYIEGTSTSARLRSQKTGELIADTPEALLYKAAQWRAPISQLPFWIMGEPTVSSAHSEYDDEGRLAESVHQGWQVSLSYRDGSRLPYKLIMVEYPMPKDEALADSPMENQSKLDTQQQTKTKVVITINNR